MKLHPERLTNDMYMKSSSFNVLWDFGFKKIELHWHEFYEMSLIVSGEGTNVINGKTYDLQKGSIFLLTPADFHELQAKEDKPFEIYNVIFSDELIEEQTRQLLFGKSSVLAATLDGEQYESMIAEYQRLSKEEKAKQPCYLNVIRGTLQRMLIDVARHCVQTNEVRENQYHSIGCIHEALIYIHHHFRGTLTLEDAAKQVQLSANYFSELFHQVTGSSFQSYVQELRIQFARTLLRASKMTVTDICYVSGFKTLSHFERVFKTKSGVTPRDYRCLDGKLEPPRC